MGYEMSFLVLLVLLFGLLASTFRILREYERGVVFMLGRFWKVKGPGLILVIPGIQQMVRVDLRTLVLDVPTQDVISRDNVSVKVNAVVYYRVLDAQKAIIEVEDYHSATSQLAQTMRCSASTNWTTCWPSASGSTAISSRYWMRRPTPGGSRWPTSRSSTSTSMNR